MLKVSVLCSIDGVLEILGICQYPPPLHNHKNIHNWLINSKSFTPKIPTMLKSSTTNNPGASCILFDKLYSVNSVNFVNGYFTGSLKVKTFLAGSFGKVKKIYVCAKRGKETDLG